MIQTKCLNLFAGPGSGKSSIGTGVFSLLKLHLISCEFTGEYAKTLAWEGRLNVKVNSLKIFAEQHHRQFILDEKVDVIVTDSPLLMSSAYRKPFDELFHALVAREFKKYDNINYFILREKKFIQKGRKESEEEANKLDHDIFSLLQREQISFKTVDGNYEAINIITNDILKRLGKKQKFFLKEKK